MIKTKVIISIIVGRAADVGKDPIPEIKKAYQFQKNTIMLKFYGQV